MIYKTTDLAALVESAKRLGTTRVGLQVETTGDHTLTVEQVAKQLKSSPDTVRQWIASGQLQAANLGKRRPRYVVTQQALASFLQTRQPEKPQSKLRRPSTSFRRYRAKP